MKKNLYDEFFSEEKMDSIFLIDESGKEYRYRDIDERVAQFCNFFSSVGLEKNQRAIQYTEKCVDALCVYLASLRYGLIYIPLNPSFQPKELAYFIDDASPSLLITMPEKLNEIKSSIANLTSKIYFETLSPHNNGTIQKKASHFSKVFKSEKIDPNDTACILYTSGTTGKPKGAMLSHLNLYTNASALIKEWEFSKNDVLLHMLPIFHCHGLFFACHSILLSGGSMRFFPSFNIDHIINQLPSSTVLMGVPTYYTRMLSDSRLSREVTKNMRLFISGSAPLLEKTFIKFKTLTGHTILERYGMTETGINTSNPVNGDRMPNSVGFPLENSQLRIVDDHNNLLPPNKPGNIQVKGLNVTQGYWNNIKKTEEAFTHDHFFKTGDIGLQSEDGRISIVGRATDLIITGGLNVYPKEIESSINLIPQVKESAIIGVPHPDFGEGVTAIVVLKQDQNISSEDIMNFLIPKLAKYKQPKKIIFISNLPRNAMGKVQKNELKKIYYELYNNVYA